MRLCVVYILYKYRLTSTPGSELTTDKLTNVLRTTYTFHSTAVIPNKHKNISDIA